MEVDKIQTTKFQRICYNNNGSSHDTSSNPNKLGTDGVTDTNGANNEFIRWPLSRIVRVSRSSGGKDRHSKVLTSKGLRDRRVRLSVSTAIQFYDLQDRLGYDQPSKAVEWLIKAAANSIDELPSLDPCFNHHVNDTTTNNNSNNNDYKVSVASKSSACSSTSETSKGSGLSLARSENRVRARERARELAAKKEKEKGSSFTDLLKGGLNSTTVTPNNNSNHENSPESTNHMNYFQMPQFNVSIGENCNEEQQQQQRHHEYAFVQENLNFVQGLNRGTLQSNVVSILPHNMNQLQRFHHQPMVDGSTNYPIFMAANMGAHEQFQTAGYDSQCLQLYCGGRNSNHHKERSKN